MGLMHWHDFMMSMRVLAHVPHEPRRAIPIALIKKMAESVDDQVFWEVQCMFFMLVLLFTFSRSECPCPKSFTGEDTWADDKHWMVRDICIRKVAGQFVLAVRFKKIKQDARLERPEARGDGTVAGEASKGGSDWAYVGDVPGHILSPFVWYRKLMAFYPRGRTETSPFFMARDRVRPYTYAAASSDLKKFLVRVSPADTDFGLHGLRVAGYNGGKMLGEDLAVAHGGWRSSASSRYDRFKLSDVFALSAVIAGDEQRVDLQREGAAVAPSPRQLTRGRVTRHRARPNSASPGAEIVQDRAEGGSGGVSPAPRAEGAQQGEEPEAVAPHVSAAQRILSAVSPRITRAASAIAAAMGGD